MSAADRLGATVRLPSVATLRGRDWLVYTVLVLLWLGVNLQFWLWWLEPAHVDAAWMYWAFTLALGYHGTFLTTAYLYYAGHMRQPGPVTPEPGLKVALITLCVPGQEGQDVIERQVEALTRVTYGHDSWVLDEGNDRRVQAIAERWGVRYFSRAGVQRYNQPGPPFKARTKAGNVNAWLDAHGRDYEVFVQFDIDHTPCPDYLDRVLGYFRDHRIAWVQAPSLYGNLSNWIARGAAEQELVLQGPLQRGFYGLTKTPFIIGSHTSYRTAAVLEIGGFQPTRAEDHLDSLVLAARRYQGVFVPDALAVGAGPETFDTYVQQQFAWAMSLTQVLMSYAPRLVWQLGFAQALQFLFAETWYPLFSAATLTLFAMPALALLTGQQPTNVELLPFLLRWVPVGVVSAAIWVWTRPWQMPAGLSLSWRGVILHVARWPIVFWAVLNALLRVPRPYMITRKGATASDRRARLGDRREGHAGEWADRRERRVRAERRERPDRRARLRAGVGPVTTLRSRLMYAVVVWCMQAVVLWFLWLDDQAGTPEHLRVEGFTLLVLWAAVFFLLVYGANVVSGTLTLWRQSRRLARVVRDYGLPVCALTVTAGFWLLLVNESSARLDTAYHTHVWPGRSMLARSTTRPTAQPAVRPREAAEQIVDPTGLAAPVDLPPDRITLGAYDPSGALGTRGVSVEHWYLRQNDASAVRAVLASTVASGAIPLITVEPVPPPDQAASVLERTIAGDADDDLTALGHAVASMSPRMVLIRWAHEMDITELYPWSTHDTELYEAAYRHVVATVRESGALNARWVWSPSGNAGSERYYPGDDVVDYVGMTVLGDEQWDRLLSNESPTTFPQLLAAKYPALSTFEKPMIICELGVSGSFEHQREWLLEAARSLPDFPLIRAIVYYNALNSPNNHIAYEPDWRIAPVLFDEFERSAGSPITPPA
jgi:cellulose synthase (UDP-forming)